MDFWGEQTGEVRAVRPRGILISRAKQVNNKVVAWEDRRERLVKRSVDKRAFYKGNPDKKARDKSPGYDKRKDCCELMFSETAASFVRFHRDSTPAWSSS